ncbi:MAG: hypothetical protein RL189_350 [Pseudomonadota bacterium]
MKILKSTLLLLLIYSQSSCKNFAPQDMATQSSSSNTGRSASRLTLSDFQKGSTRCYDRRKNEPRAVVDAHLHARPFGGPPVPFPSLLDFVRNNGVLFTAIYGIGQRLPTDSSCTYYLNCLGTPALPSIKNDFFNAQSILDAKPEDIKIVLSMTFPDLSKPEEILPQMNLLDKEFPGMFRWMGEVNLVKQALFNNGHTAIAADLLPRWKPFMDELLKRKIPIAIHSDLGNDDEPEKYKNLMDSVLSSYPENRIVWMHLGLSKELKRLDHKKQIAVLESYLQKNRNLYFDLSWRVLYDQIFSQPEFEPLYIDLLNRWPDRFIPGTDFVAAAGKTEKIYAEELRLTSAILGKVNDEAYRRIALGQNFFELAGLEAVAPQVCR